MLHGGGAASKGWSALAGAHVAAGGFVCLYAGELLRSGEAAARLATYDDAAAARPGDPGHALLVRSAGDLPMRIGFRVECRVMPASPWGAT